MDMVVPWAELFALIEPYYPKATNAGGRPPVGLDRMLRIHCTACSCGNLSDLAVEEALYDSRALREWAYATPYNHSSERAAMLDRWIHHYSWHRPHQESRASHPSVASLNPQTTS